MKRVSTGILASHRRIQARVRWSTLTCTRGSDPLDQPDPLDKPDQPTLVAYVEEQRTAAVKGQVQPTLLSADAMSGKAIPQRP
jgi:hypothetical protein